MEYLRQFFHVLFDLLLVKGRVAGNWEERSPVDQTSESPSNLVGKTDDIRRLGAGALSDSDSLDSMAKPATSQTQPSPQDAPPRV